MKIDSGTDQNTEAKDDFTVFFELKQEHLMFSQ